MRYAEKNMNWESIIEFFGGAAALTGLFAYLGKITIESYLAGKLESHKKNLERIAAEHAIRFQHLHSERAMVVKELYEKLVKIDESLYSTLRRFQAVEEGTLETKVNTLGNNFNELRNYYLPKRIFFEESLCETIETILESAKGIFYDITTYAVSTDDLSYKYDRELLEERHQFWEKARGIHENEVSELKKILENEFRNILGINA
jgi:hypothetical protein